MQMKKKLYVAKHWSSLE